MRVLVVEDELIIALDIESLLIENGHEVCGLATTSHEAVELAALNQPDLVISDISLAKGTNGISSAMEIVSRYNTAVIFISAAVASLTQDDLETVKPVALISKPIDANLVSKALQKATDHIRSSNSSGRSTR